MKFQIMSDIHDEFLAKDRSYLLKGMSADADALLLAGDITIPRYMDRLASANFLKPVYYVLGNHEYYHGDWDESLDEYKSFCGHTHNINVLENEMRMIDNVRLLACTLWTDFWVPNGNTRNNHAFNCFRGMADFIVIRGITISGWEERNRRSLEFLKLFLATKYDGPTIVMTHHAPSFKSSHPKYAGSQISGGFCSDLDYLIEEYQPDYWIHGHCHESFDYKIGNTRIICNPRGYESIELNPDFNDKLIIEV